MKEGKLQQITHRALDLDIQWDKVEKDPYLNSPTLTEIRNAWKKYALVDSAGNVWVSINGLKSILRLAKNGKNIANLIIDKYIPECDQRKLDGVRYVRGTTIGKLIDQNIQSSKSASKREYSLYAQALYIHFVRDDKLKVIRHKFWQAREAQIKNLKSFRIRKKNVSRDELTGKRLYSRSCHFSHIRSMSLYPELAFYYWNGLIVNARTHKLITKEDIHDEKGLQDLCEYKKWKLDWMGEFKVNLSDIGFTPYTT